MSGVVAGEGAGGHKSHTGIPVLHAGSHFRHGLLQLMIHTIDPLHDGKAHLQTAAGRSTIVFQLQDTVCLFGTLLVFDSIHLPKGETRCLIGSEQKEKEIFLLFLSCCFEVNQFCGGLFYELGQIFFLEFSGNLGV